MYHVFFNFETGIGTVARTRLSVPPIVPNTKLIGSYHTLDRAMRVLNSLYLGYWLLIDEGIYEQA